MEEVAKIEISLLANGGAHMVATCGGQPDCSYVVMPDRQLPVELEMLLGGARARWCISRGLSPDGPG